MLGTLARAGAVLDLFTTEEPEWGVTATAQRLGIGKSLAHDVLASLAGIGLLQRVGHGRYRLGWRTVTLASVLLRTSALKAHARPVVRDLAERQGLTVSLAAWDCGRIIYIDRRYSARRDERLRSGRGNAGATRRQRRRQGAAREPAARRRSRRCGAMGWSTRGTPRSMSWSSISSGSDGTAGRTTDAEEATSSSAVAAPVRDADGNRRGGDQPRPARPVLDREHRPSRARRGGRGVANLGGDPPPRAARRERPIAWGAGPEATRLLAENVSVNCWSGLGSSGGVTTMTGRPSASTRVGRSFRSHSDRRLGSVEIRMSS